MRQQKRALREYQQALIDAYYDMQMHSILDPLYDAFQQWKRGGLQHSELTELIHKVHRENQKVYSFFTQSRTRIINCIRMDQAWFENWKATHPPLPRIEL
ncbi:MAG: hypothetical protein FJ023_02055 [Chloroflexi bacterium]|nr:hypothetical protein [Chloroflexota bacterium]